MPSCCSIGSALDQAIEQQAMGLQQDDTTGLDPETQAPFFDLLQQEIAIATSTQTSGCVDPGSGCASWRRTRG
ncbi:hypothetical protein KQ310_06385 [Synechococcus sp. CS-1328]|nr:hypothetical protein [Synechococcus sp. CS-1328]